MRSSKIFSASGASSVEFATVGDEVEIKIVGEEDAIVWIPRWAFMSVAAQIAGEYEPAGD